MKVRLQRADNTFTPFEIAIEFESYEEASDFYNLFNYALVVDELAPALDDDMIRETINEANSRLGNTAIASKISRLDDICKNYEG